MLASGGPLIVAGRLTGWLLLASAVCAALVGIWKAAKWFGGFTERAATLDAIAAEFRPDHGTSLRDVIDVVKTSAIAAATVAQTAATAAATAEAHALESAEASNKNTEQLVELNSYMHDFVHTNRNMTTVIAGHVGMLTQTIAKLQDVIYERAAQIREDDPPTRPDPIPELKFPDK